MSLSGSPGASPSLVLSLGSSIIGRFGGLFLALWRDFHVHVHVLILILLSVLDVLLFLSLATEQILEGQFVEFPLHMLDVGGMGFGQEQGVLCLHAAVGKVVVALDQCRVICIGAGAGAWLEWDERRGCSCRGRRSTF